MKKFTVSVKGEDFEIPELSCLKIKNPSFEVPCYGSKNFKIKENGIFFVTMKNEDTPSVNKIYKWLKKVYNYKKSNIENCDVEVTLCFYDEEIREKWILHQVIPIEINFGDLNYSTSSEFKFDVKLEYQSCEYISYWGFNID